MSQPPYASYSPVPQKYRPRPRWFVVGGLLVVLGVVACVGGLYLALQPLTVEDAIVPADGTPTAVSVPGDSDRAIYVRDGEPATCAVADADGTDLELKGVSGTFTSNEWTAALRFDSGTGELTVTCTAALQGTEVRLGAVPSGRRFAGGLALGIGGPVVLGLAGLGVLVTTAILYATRPPRPREAGSYL